MVLKLMDRSADEIIYSNSINKNTQTHLKNIFDILFLVSFLTIDVQNISISAITPVALSTLVADTLKPKLTSLILSGKVEARDFAF